MLGQKSWWVEGSQENLGWAITLQFAANNNSQNVNLHHSIIKKYSQFLLLITLRSLHCSARMLQGLKEFIVHVY